MKRNPRYETLSDGTKIVPRDSEYFEDIYAYCEHNYDGMADPRYAVQCGNLCIHHLEEISSLIQKDLKWLRKQNDKKNEREEYLELSEQADYDLAIMAEYAIGKLIEIYVEMEN